MRYLLQAGQAAEYLALKASFSSHALGNIDIDNAALTRKANEIECQKENMRTSLRLSPVSTQASIKPSFKPWLALLHHSEAGAMLGLQYNHQPPNRPAATSRFSRAQSHGGKSARATSPICRLKPGIIWSKAGWGICYCVLCARQGGDEAA